MGDGYIDEGQWQEPSRRELIRRGAILLGVGAWAAPLVQVVRQRGHGDGGDGAAAPEVIGVQQVTGECATCTPSCGSVTECGSSGIFICFCAPSASVYPMAACICASDVFCDEATPCSAGCPEGWACAQGCCPEPVCLPPCPPGEVLARSAPPTPGSGSRLTASGRRL